MLLLLLVPWVPSVGHALPSRLVLALDGVAYRDLKALQAGAPGTNWWGKTFIRQAFSAREGYFPVSRMISTFPSTSDVAWTDIFGDRPLPGYQRTYYSAAANRQMAVSAVTTSMEHEKQMDWELQNSFLRSMAYVYSVHVYEYELHELEKNFFAANSTNENFYAYIRSSDDAQHLGRNIMAMLCLLDRRLEQMRARYRKMTGRDLQIVILSDHGHNHAGPGKRVLIRSFLEKAGYRIADSLACSNDVVLPTTGIETWVEIHNAPAVTEKLAHQLTHLAGVDLVLARLAQTNRFLVLNSRDAAALIDWRPASNAFRYSPVNGDPLDYSPVVETLAREHQLDTDGFAPADVWMAATLTNRYPVALERIVRGFTQVTLNPATILLSLDNHYVNAGWLVKKGSELVTCDSTHGGLDDLNSDGILLSNFKPTRDTSSDRVAEQFDGFPGLRNFRETETGAEWVTPREQAMTRLARDPFDRDCRELPASNVFLRVWSPRLDSTAADAPIEVVLKKVPRYAALPAERGALQLPPATGQRVTLNAPVAVPEMDCERIYALPPDLILQPHARYQISGWLGGPAPGKFLFEFDFYTNARGQPAAY